MKQITKTDIKRLAKEYDCDAQYLMDVTLDMEGDGIFVTADMLEDYLIDGTI